MRDALIKLHISVFLAGFTGVLGALIQLNEGLLVWYRIMITVVSLLFLLQVKKQLQRIPASMVWKLLGIGTLIAMHWVFFYGSIKMANVSIGLVCFASTGLFTALLEPVFNHKKINFWDIGLGLLSLLGILLIFQFDQRYREGIIAGIISAILAALFTVLNKRQVNKVEPRVMMVYELSGGLLLLTLLMPLYLHYYPVTSILPTLTDWLWLLMLGWLCTVLAMDLMLQALQKVSAFTQNLSLNLEPVYGIILAFVLFGEQKQLGDSFYIGVSLITLSVVLQMIRVIKQHRQLQRP
jgi:drug/metabolite transporter (DMT)-like permease